MTFAELIGQGICHQLPARSFWLDGHPFFICGRCAGIYWGLVASYITLWWRGHMGAVHFPDVHWRWFLFACLGVMPLDVLANIVLNTNWGNWFRCSTGLMLGASAVFFLQPFVARKIAVPILGASFENRTDLFSVIGIILCWLLVFWLQPSFILVQFYEIITLLSILLTFSIINLLTLLYIVMPHQAIRTRRTRVAFFAVGMMLTFMEIYLVFVYKKFLLVLGL